jgi:beta-lactamase class D
MRLLFCISLCATLTSCAKKPVTPAELFAGKDGCILLMDAKSGTFIKAWNEGRCRERFPACSTFKVPLALMAFDTDVLKDEKQVLKWDGEKRMLAAWDRDHNAATWMQESVVWFSQRLTPKLREARVKKYLRDFRYGNEDLSGGLTDAWLHAPDSDKAALRISAYEQAEFMKGLWTDRLKITPAAAALTKKITFFETSPQGYQLSGKTGSNFYGVDKKKRLGWFIGHLQKGAEEYIIVTNFSDTEIPAETMFGGKKAREITKAYLESIRLW